MRFRTSAFALTALFLAMPSFARRISVWIPPWDDAALHSIQPNGDEIQESNPVWYSWNSDGSIAKNWNAEGASWRAAMTGSQLVPTIQNVSGGRFDRAGAAAMLGSAASRHAHAEAIAALVNQNAFDGIDVDYESVPAASRADFTAFLATLGETLHASGKILSVTVHPKTSDRQNWDGPGSQDWVAIGQVADSVKIMAYDYHWDTSDPGAITPLDWLDKVATYAESVIPNGKIMIGLPWYGYDWSNGSGRTASFASAMEIARSNGATVRHDADGEATYTYGNHTVFFQDATSYAKKIGLLESKHGSIGGFAHWAAGQEDPEIWKLLRGSSVPAQTAPADFTIAGPDSVTVAQGQAAIGEYRVIPINGFAAPVTVSVHIDGFDGTVSPSASSVTAGSLVTASVVPSRGAAAGVYSMTVRMTSGSLVHELAVKVVVAQTAPARARAVRR
jgi:spore germination protein YaaH